MTNSIVLGPSTRDYDSSITTVISLGPVSSHAKVAASILDPLLPYNVPIVPVAT